MAPKLTLENFDRKKFIEKELRRAFKRCPLYNEAKNRAKREYFEESKHGKLMRRVHFECAQCGRFFRDENRNIAVDHITSVVCTSTGPTLSLDVYTRRLFCNINNLQILCNFSKKDDGELSCHAKKTKQERQDLAMIIKTNKSRGIEEVEWVTIAEFPDYEVSNTGFVRNKKNESIMKLSDNGKGYKSLCFGRTYAGNNTRRYIHRLVAEAFISKTDGKNHINHKDGDKENNCVTNLEWVDPSENVKHSWDTGLSACTPKVLTSEMVIDIYNEATDGVIPQTAIAKKYGVCQQTISEIKRKLIWKHITDGL